MLIEAGESETALDDTVGSLSRQNGSRFRAIFIGPQAEANRESLSLEDGRFAIAPEGAADYLAALAGPDDPILMLDPGTTLADGLLARIRAVFDELESRLAYAQHRRSDGSLGRAGRSRRRTRLTSTRGAPLLPTERPLPCALRFSPTRPARATHSSAPPASLGRAFWDEVWTLAAPERPEPPTSRDLPAAFVGKNTPPRISCLMVTCDRLALAKRAIRSYAAQSWPHKELVIVTAGAPRFRDALSAYLADLGVDAVRLVHHVADDPPLGPPRADGTSSAAMTARPLPIRNSSRWSESPLSRKASKPATR